MDDLIYLIYVMFSLKEVTLGTVLFAVGCIIVVAAFLTAFIMAVTAKRSKRRLEQRMKEKY